MFLDGASEPEMVYSGTVIQSLDLKEIPEMTYGGTYTLPTTTNEGQTLKWKVADGSIASISNGKLTAQHVGSTILTAIQSGNDEYSPLLEEFLLTVNKASLVITADDCSKMAGEENPVFTFRYSGFVNGDDAVSLTKQPKASTTATMTSPAGTYPIIVSGAESPNYIFTYINGTLTVKENSTTPKPLRGDVNEDGSVDVADIATIISIMAGKDNDENVNKDSKEWDFTKGLSIETIINLDADAANWEKEGTDAGGNTTGWKETVKHTGELEANSVVIAECSGIEIGNSGLLDFGNVIIRKDRIRLTRNEMKFTLHNLPTDKLSLSTARVPTIRLQTVA